MDLERIPDLIDRALAPLLGFVDTSVARLRTFRAVSVLAGVAFVVGVTGGWLLDGGLRTLVALVVTVGALLPAAALHGYIGRLAGARDDVASLTLALRGWAVDETRAERIEQLLAPAAEIRDAGSRRRQALAAAGFLRQVTASAGDVRGLTAVSQRLTLTFGALGGLTLVFAFVGTALLGVTGAGLLVVRAVLRLV